jgi:hypothetical protein
MPAVSRKSGTDTVASPDGAGYCSGDPSTQTTDVGSDDVLANAIGVIRSGDTVITHLHPGPCDTPHNPALDSYSPNVFANNKNLGRFGDTYGGDHIVSSGSTNVFANEPGDLIGDIFIPENPYQPAFVAKVTEQAGGNAPHDDPDSEVISYGTPADTAPGPENPTAETDETPAAKTNGTPIDCGDFSVDPIDYNQNLTENFTIKNLTIGALFAHKIVAQNGFTEAEVICNLKGLAENILEPLKVKYPGFRINSGFRKGTSTSQHNRGMACDLQWPGITPAQYTPIAEWIRSNLPFDQLIFEHGNSIWLHLAYNRTQTKQRGVILTYYPKASPAYKPGLTNYYA